MHHNTGKKYFKSGDKRGIVKYIRVDKKTAENIEKTAKNFGMSESFIMYNAIRFYLDSLNKKV